MTLDQQFNIINEKLQQLLKQQARLKRENGQLKLALEQQKSEDAKTKTAVAELSQQVSILKLAAGEMNEKDKKEFEKKINRYIKVVDDCIAYLGQ
jgi:chromosome segregation ATPase